MQCALNTGESNGAQIFVKHVQAHIKMSAHKSWEHVSSSKTQNTGATHETSRFNRAKLLIVHTKHLTNIEFGADGWLQKVKHTYLSSHFPLKVLYRSNPKRLTDLMDNLELKERVWRKRKCGRLSGSVKFTKSIWLPRFAPKLGACPMQMSRTWGVFDASLCDG